MKKVWSALGALALAILGVVGTTSPKDATSNVAGWLEWAGITKLPGFITGALADRILQMAVAVVLAVVLTRFFYRRAAFQSAEGDLAAKDRADSQISSSMDTMAYRLRHVRDREWWDQSDPNEEVFADLDAFGLTLHKAGFVLPHPNKKDDPRDQLNVFIDYLFQVGALLRNGHGKEARVKAREWAARYPPEPKQN